MELFMVIPQHQPIAYSSRFRVAMYLSHVCRVSFLAFLLSVTQIAAQAQTSEHVPLRLMTHESSDFNFKAPEGWRVQTKRLKNLKLILMQENPADPHRSPSLMRMAIHTEKETPQGLIRKLVSSAELQNLRVLNEQTVNGGYIVLIGWRYDDNLPGMGFYYSYINDQGELVAVSFTAPRDRFELLGGPTLAVTAFPNSWIRVD